jgi:hypothetical protein
VATRPINVFITHKRPRILSVLNYNFALPYRWLHPKKNYWSRKRFKTTGKLTDRYVIENCRCWQWNWASSVQFTPYKTRYNDLLSIRAISQAPCFACYSTPPRVPSLVADVNDAFEVSLPVALKLSLWNIRLWSESVKAVSRRHDICASDRRTDARKSDAEFWVRNVKLAGISTEGSQGEKGHVTWCICYIHNTYTHSKPVYRAYYFWKNCVHHIRTAANDSLYILIMYSMYTTSCVCEWNRHAARLLAALTFPVFSFSFIGKKSGKSEIRTGIISMYFRFFRSCKI